jgi:cytochrome c biogenesis protein CcmG/thiol:disulfide interchange protein DsbE
MESPAPKASSLDRPLVRALIAAALLAALVGAFAAVRAARGSSSTTASNCCPMPADGAQLGPLTGTPPTVGQPAPDFALRTPDGAVVKLSDLRGSVVLVNFWATWCRPCKQELPDIQHAYDEFHARGLEVLEVDYQESAGDAAAFFKEHNITLPMVLDSEGGVYAQYRLQGLPDSFFVTRDGTIAALQFGQLTADKIRERLTQAGLQ